jgi:hypothetical protein
MRRQAAGRGYLDCGVPGRLRRERRLQADLEEGRGGAVAVFGLDAGPLPEIAVTDTGSYSEVVFQLLELLDFSYWPALADLPARKLARQSGRLRAARHFLCGRHSDDQQELRGHPADRRLDRDLPAT